jgi:4-amino-4-deoxy-L-arabinose transferase-like glycosyltransferase
VVTTHAAGQRSAIARARALVAAHPDAAALTLIVAVAVAIRVAFAFRVPVFLLRDSISYFLPAWDLLNGYGFDLSIRRTPVYPGFIVGALAIFGEDLLAVAFAQHILGVVSAALVYVLGRMTVGRAAGFIAALVTALNGALIIAEHYVMPEVALIFLLLVTFVVFVGAVRSGRLAGFAASGVLLGLALLCKPVAQVLIPVLPFMVAVSYGSIRRAVVPSLLIGAGLLAVMVPWMARNAVVHGSVTTAGALGQTLLARTAKHDTGFRWYDDKQADHYERREGIARQLVQNGIRQRLSDGVIYRRIQDRFGMADAEINQFMRVLSTEVILDDPVYYLRGTAKMTWQLLAGEPEKLSTDWKTQNARLSREEWDDRVEHLLSRATTAQRNELVDASTVVSLVQPPAWGPTMPILFILGSLLFLLRRELRPALLLSLSVLALLVTCAALDGPVVRYRYPADPLVALVAAAALTMAFEYAVRLVRRARGGHTPASESAASPAAATGSSIAGPAPSSPLARPTPGQAPRGA